jgi:hypothetical protein
MKYVPTPQKKKKKLKDKHRKAEKNIMKTHQDRSGAVPLFGTLAQHNHHLDELSTI